MSSYELGHLALSDNGFLFDSISGFTYTLNKTGQAILKGFIEHLDEADIAKNLILRFDVDEKTAQKDIQQFIHYLKEMNLIPKSE